MFGIRTGKQQPPAVSVVMPTHLGAERITAALESLARQRLPRSEWELVVVRNGPDDGTAAILADFGARHRGLRMTVADEPATPPGPARNLGMRISTGRYITFVDDDDTVSPGFLSSLLAVAGPDRVAIAQRVDLDESKHELPPSVYSRIVANHAGRRIPLRRARPVVHLGACKLAPRHMLMEVPFPADMTSGEDVVIWMSVMGVFAPDLVVVDDPDDAVYYRWRRPGSVARRIEVDHDFAVNQRLLGIGHVTGVYERVHDEDLLDLCRQSVTTVAAPMRRWQRDHPQDAADIDARIDALDTPLFPWGDPEDIDCDTVTIAGCFPPHDDREARAAADYVRQRGTRTDILWRSSGGTHPIRPDTLAGVGRLLAWTRPLITGRAEGSAEDLQRYLSLGSEALQRRRDRRSRDHHQVRSVSEQAGAHLLAALTTARENAVWEAVWPAVPDPGPTLPSSPLTDELTAMVPPPVSSPQRAGELALVLAALYADTVVVPDEASSRMVSDVLSVAARHRHPEVTVRSSSDQDRDARSTVSDAPEERDR